MKTLVEIIDVVDLLTDKDRQALLDYLALRKQSKRKSDLTGNRDRDLWHTAVIEALEIVLRTGGGLPPTLAVVNKLYSGSYASVETFVASAFPGLKATEKMAGFRVLADLLVRHADYVAKKSGAPLSAKLTFSCVQNLPGLVDNAFPGYIESGLLPMIIRNHQLNRGK